MAVFLVNLFVASELPRHFPIGVCAHFCLAKLLSQGWSDVQLPFAPGGICEDVLSTWLLKTVADTKTFKDAKFAKRILGHDGGQHVVMTWREHMQQQLSISQIECECVIEHQICIKQLCSNTCIQATEGQHNNIKQHICNWKWTHCPDTVSDEHTHTLLIVKESTIVESPTLKVLKYLLTTMWNKSPHFESCKTRESEMCQVKHTRDEVSCSHLPHWITAIKSSIDRRQRTGFEGIVLEKKSNNQDTMNRRKVTNKRTRTNSDSEIASAKYE